MVRKQCLCAIERCKNQNDRTKDEWPTWSRIWMVFDKTSDFFVSQARKAKQGPAKELAKRFVCGADVESRMVSHKCLKTNLANARITRTSEQAFVTTATNSWFGGLCSCYALVFACTYMFPSTASQWQTKYLLSTLLTQHVQGGVSFNKHSSCGWTDFVFISFENGCVHWLMENCSNKLALPS